jgi:hypothetical protein
MIPPISMLGAIGVSYVIGKGYSGHYAICVVCGLNVDDPLNLLTEILKKEKNECILPMNF